MRLMGADSVDYHRVTIIERGDDFAGRALAYYASRGETPLVWGGAGAERLGLTGTVTDAQYEALFGPGGAADPTTGTRLVSTRRPGMELVVSAHKSVALLGLVGRAEDMHAILDAETDATLAYLDDWARTVGGRRGRAQHRAPTAGLVWARTRHATSRAADPEPHDHVLVANLTEMADAAGGWKALDTASVRDLLHAATIVGRMASAARALELGYAIEADHGPSGRLGHWRIGGIPPAACEVFSKRSAEITAAVEARGVDTYRARGVAARTTRAAKRHTPVAELMPAWTAELEAAGFGVGPLADLVEQIGRTHGGEPGQLKLRELRSLVAEMLGPAGPLAEQKVFTRADAIVAVGPRLFGRRPDQLTRAVDAVLASPNAIPLLGVVAVRERAYVPACVLATEAAIAATVAKLAVRTDAPAVTPRAVEEAMAAKERSLGRRLTEGQRKAVAAMATSGRAVELVLGVAGAGKTTALDVTRAAFEDAGYVVVGTSTSGQAARTLGREANIEESRTMASLLWRLEHGRMRLDDTTVVICDEAGMADDPSVLRLLAAVEAARAKLVMVGDHRQLGAVGPGGAMEALVARQPGAVHVLDENVRQRDPDERLALGELRDGDVGVAIDFYRSHDRIRTAPSRAEALDVMVGAWTADVEQGSDSAMMAWRRANVAELNRLGRERWGALGRLSGPELVVGDRRYAAGDRIVTLAPGADGELVTSERGTVRAVDRSAGTLTAAMDDGRLQHFAVEDTAADHLAHSYAVTVHRSQGATVDRAHLFADGGGRELGYVGMSRARDTAHVWLAADDVDQAVEDLAREWKAERRQRWAIDSGTPATSPLAVEIDERAPAAMRLALRRARLQAERDAVAAAVLADPAPALARLEFERHRLREQRFDLEYGRGQWTDTPAGEAARALRRAEGKRIEAETFAAMPDVGWRMRRTWRADARAWELRGREALTGYEAIVRPELDRLDAGLARLDERVDGLGSDVERNRLWKDQHPEVAGRLASLDAQLRLLDHEIRQRGLNQAVGTEMEPLGLGPKLPDRGFGLGL